MPCRRAPGTQKRGAAARSGAEGSVEHIKITNVCAASAIGSTALQQTDVDFDAMVRHRRESTDAYPGRSTRAEWTLF